MVEINEFHLEDIKNPKHSSTFIQSKDYNILILRLFKLKAKKIEPYNINLIFSKDEIWHFKDDKFSPIGSHDSLFEFLDIKINTILDIVSIVSIKIEKLENQFYENQGLKDFNKTWFFNKNNLIKISRILIKADEAFEKFLKFYHHESQELNIKFDDLLEHLQRSSKSTSYVIENLDTLYRVYSTNKDEKMQHSIYILTMISGIFLPLNFIVGFFGINTSSLPFTRGEGGTYFVILILILSAIVFSLIFRFIDKKS